MFVVLSLVYFILLSMLAIPFRLMADPLMLRFPRRARWIERHNHPGGLDNMRKQG